MMYYFVEIRAYREGTRKLFEADNYAEAKAAYDKAIAYAKEHNEEVFEKDLEYHDGIYEDHFDFTLCQEQLWHGSRTCAVMLDHTLYQYKGKFNNNILK